MDKTCSHKWAAIIVTTIISTFCWVEVANATEPNYVPGQLLVRFAPKAKGIQRSTAEKNQILGSLGGATIKRNYTIVPGLSLVKLPAGQTVKDALETFNKADEILYAERNYIAYATLTVPNDTRFDELWGMHNTGQTGGTADADIDAPEAWDTETDASEIIVAVIDTGVDYTHPDLAANMWVNEAELNGIPDYDDDGNGYVDDIYGYDFCNDDGDPIDDRYHGTHCAGTVGAVGNNGVGVAGVCWNVRIMAVKFLNAGGGGSYADAISSIQYATQMQANLSSNSWGGYGYSQGLKNAIDAAGNEGILFVAAAGNPLDSQDPNNDTNPLFPASFNSDNIIAVMATDHDDERSIWPEFNRSSAYGPTSVDLAAPGTDILSTFPTYMTPAMDSEGFSTDYETISGTSMATPHVSGACALVWAVNPSLSHLEVKGIILSTVDVIPELEDDPDPQIGRTCVTGGRLNLNNAVFVEYWVHPDGNDSNPGTQQEPFRTIQHAVNQCTDANNDIIRVQDDPCEPNDYVTPPIRVNCNKVHFIFQEGVLVEAKSGAFPDYNDCLFEVWSKSNIIFDGYGATFRMKRSEYPEWTEHRHVILLRSCSNIEILGLTLKDSGGDGIFMGRRSGALAYCDNILIKDVTCDNNYRNAIAPTSANNLTIEDCVLKNTNGFPLGPCAGIDCEPIYPSDRLTNIVVRNCVFENNDGYGICVSLYALDNTSEDISLLFEDCYVTGGNGNGIWVALLYYPKPNGSVGFKNITVEDVVYGARLVDKSSENGASVYFTNCVWQNIKTGGKPVYIEVTHYHETVNKAGGFEFIDCQVYDDVDRPAIEYKCVKPPETTLYEVHGDLYVINPNRTGSLKDWHGDEDPNGTVDITVQRGVADFLKAFGVKNSSGEYVAVFDNLGSLVLADELYPSSSHPASGHDEFRFQDVNGVDVAIIDTTNGKMYIKGTLKLDSQGNWVAPTDGDDNFRIQDSGGNDVAYISKTGDTYLKGELYEDAEP